MIFQLLLLSFPLCLFTFGLNDIHDHRSDRMNPRKRGIEGTLLETRYHRMVRMAAFGVGVLFLSVSAATLNAANLYFAVTLLCLAYVYSVPPWRLKTRPPLDVISAGILGFFAPFGLGFSLVDDATLLPLQAYCFTCCVMGFHAFSTIMDYDVDRRVGDRTFAVAYGKRAAALFPAAIFLCSLPVVRVDVVRDFFIACLILFVATAVFPSEKFARYTFLALFLGAVVMVGGWIGSVMLR
jgi:chlorophyll synthase